MVFNGFIVCFGIELIDFCIILLLVAKEHSYITFEFIRGIRMFDLLVINEKLRQVELKEEVIRNMAFASKINKYI